MHRNKYLHTFKNRELFNLLHKFSLDIHGIGLFILEVLGRYPTSLLSQVLADIPPKFNMRIENFAFSTVNLILLKTMHLNEEKKSNLVKWQMSPIVLKLLFLGIIKPTAKLIYFLFDHFRGIHIKRLRGYSFSKHV